MLLLRNTYKVTLQYLFNVFILFNTVSYFKFNLKLKIDLKCVLLKICKKFENPLKIKKKTNGNPEVNFI